MRAHHAHNNLFRDLAIIAISILVAVLLVKTGAIDAVVARTPEGSMLESFVAGFFFTSVFTTAPAIVVLGKIAAGGSVLGTALVGAAGALLGDFIIFSFIRENLVADFLHLLSRTGRERFRHIIHRRLFRWFTPLVGALVIASPLPDELGLMLLGFSKTRMKLFVPFSFGANFAGILVIGLLAKKIF